MRPQSIIRFEQIFFAAIAVSLLNTLMSFGATEAQLANDPSSAQLGLGSGFLIATLAFSIGIMLLLWFFIARRASNVAKWILVAITGLGLAMMLGTISALSAAPPLTLLLTVVNTGLQIAGLAFLFKRDAVEWLTTKGQGGATDPSIFD